MNSAAPSPRAGTATYRHGRVPRDVRTQQVYDLAIEMFTERGYRNTAMEDLARRAGVSKALVYGLVGTKDQLFEACVERSLAELATAINDAVEGAQGLEPSLRAGSLAFFQFVARHHQAWVSLLSGEDAPLTAKMAEIHRRQGALVTDLIAASLTPTERAAIGPKRIAALGYTVNAAIDALAMWSLDHPDIPPEELTDWTAELFVPGLERLLNRTP